MTISTICPSRPLLLSEQFGPLVLAKKGAGGTRHAGPVHLCNRNHVGIYPLWNPLCATERQVPGGLPDVVAIRHLLMSICNPLDDDALVLLIPVAPKLLYSSLLFLFCSGVPRRLICGGYTARRGRAPGGQ